MKTSSVSFYFQKKAIRLIGLFLLICVIVLFNPTLGMAKKPVPPTTETPTGEEVPDGWPLWPVPVNEGPFYDFGPLSFTYINRPVYPYVEYIQPTETFSTTLDIWWGQVGVNVWGTKLNFVRAGESNPQSVLFPGIGGVSGERKIYIGVEDTPNVYDLMDHDGVSVSSVQAKLRSFSVIPEYIGESESWEIEDLDGDPVANQYFLDSWTESWITFLASDEKAGEAMQDSGHSTPLISWPDNPWVVTMAGHPSFVAEMEVSYLPWGGAVAFLATNEGLLHAFTILDGNSQEQWSILPMPSFKVACYQEYLKMISDENTSSTTSEQRARFTFLDGPISVHDVELNGDGTKDSWKRILVGTTGIGTWMKDKIQEAWTYEGHPISGDFLIANERNAIGAYAFDITNPLEPKEQWSFLYDGAALHRNGALAGTITSETESALQEIEMLLGRPVFGYTIQDDSTRIWHVLLAGVDTDGKYHLLDLNALTGEVLHSIALSDNVVSGLMAYVEEYLPTRIAAVLPKGETTPILSEVYVYLSDGKIYRWDLQNDPENPENLLQLNLKYQSNYYGAPATQEFDATYLWVGNELHRFLAVPVLIEKTGSWGGGERNCLVVLDITKLENEYEGDYPYELILKAEWGVTNQVEDLQVQKTDPLNIAANIYLAIDHQQESLMPVSAPIFYKGNILLATTGTNKDGDYSTLFYNVDPLAEDGNYSYNSEVESYGDAIGLGKDTDPMEGRAVGGAFIDEHGVVWSPVYSSDGTTTLVSADFGLDPEGTGFSYSASADQGEGIEVVYWKQIAEN